MDSKLAILAAVASDMAEAALAALEEAIDRARAANDAIVAVCVENGRAAADAESARAAMAPADASDAAFYAALKARDAAFEVAGHASRAVMHARLAAK
jgi:hypothetical protein